jgi:CRISPR-associated protein Csx14
VLAADGDRFVIEHWGEESRRTGRDTVKFWAGAGGYPGAALVRDALDLARPMLRSITPDPFAAAVIQTSSFRFDWRRDYIPIDAGFSLNNHGDAIRPRGYPVVELLAAMGLRYARPARLHRLEYKYGVVGRSPGESADSAILPSQFLRAALGCADLPFSSRTFHMCLGWPGQEGQARSVTSVYEENQ